MAGGPAPYNRKNRAKSADYAAIVFDLHLSGLSFRSIDTLTQDPSGPTDGHRISTTSAKELVYAEAARRVDPRVDEYRAIELGRLEQGLERLANMEASVREVMGRKHITVNNGRVIKVINPETLAEEPVEDDTFILQAVDRLNRIEESRRRTSDSIRRLLGLDMPVKVDATITETTQQDLELAELVREAKAKNATEEARLKGGGE
jgi:hypothetical protein